MKCLSVMQPWATLLVHALKRYETRTWATKHRGCLFIHASRRFDRAAQLLITQEPCAGDLEAIGIRDARDLPRGAIIGVVRLTDVLEAPPLAVSLSIQTSAEFQDINGAKELAYGNFSVGRYAWRCDHAKPIPPIPTGGKLGLFDIPRTVIEQASKVFPAWTVLIHRLSWRRFHSRGAASRSARRGSAAASRRRCSAEVNHG